MAIKLGTAGNDPINGTAGWDTLYGLGGSDTLNGGKGSDILSGGDGNDILIGGAGPDSLHGGAGGDTSRYSAFSDAQGDRIIDFSSADRIDFSAIAAAGRHFIGNAQFNGIVGEIRYEPGFGSFNNNSSIFIDTDGDALNDISFTVFGSFNFVETAANSGILIAATNQTKKGGAGNDTLNGGAGNDTLSGLAGIDTLNGDEGNDKLSGGDGSDILIGGLGTDTYTGEAGNDTFRFAIPDDIKNDTITDFASGDKIAFAFKGMDYIGDVPFSRTPGEYRYEETGNIQFDFDGDGIADHFINVSINAPAPVMLQESAPAGSNILEAAPNQTLNGTAGNDTKTGGNGNDILNGLAGNDTLNGGMGRDTLGGDIGDDILNGSSGNDTLGGDDGTDALNGGIGNDALNGGNGTDTLVGGLGADALTGGAGNDIFKYNALTEISDQNTSSFGTPPNPDRITDIAIGDKINLSAIAGLHFVGLGNNFSGAGNEIRVTNTLFGTGTGFDIDTNGDKIADYSLTLTGSPTLEETTAGSLIFQVPTDLTKTGTAGNDTRTGGNGNDTLNGLAGNDTLSGGYGQDKLNGGDGADTLIGGLGADTLAGGAGNDIFKFNALAELGSLFSSPFNDTITDLQFGDKINLSAIPDLSFVGLGNNFSGAGNEIRVQGSLLGIDTNGDKNADYTLLLTGSPTLEETAPGSLIFQVPEDLTLTGTAGNDTKTGGNGNDAINGLGGNDTLSGDFGNDILNGDDGADTLIGGLGADTLTGGAGNDIFKYNALAEIASGSPGERITDLQVGDKINLSAIPGLSFVGLGNDFSGAGNEIRVQSGNLGIDTNGDKFADFTLFLNSSLLTEETAPGSMIFQVPEDQTLTGTAGNDTKTGGNGNDTINGLGGNDTLSGGFGKDKVNGGDGADTLVGGLSQDTLTGENGNDTFKFNTLAEISDQSSFGFVSNSDGITDLQVGDKINLSAIPDLNFVGLGNDFSGSGNEIRTITDFSGTHLDIDTNGDKLKDYSLSLTGSLILEETASGSQIFQIPADQTLTGTAGNDIKTGGNGNDTINGLAGNDTLNGGFGADTLNGDNGTDTLIGGLGADTLTGGAGNDIFKFLSSSEIGSGETITDFATGDLIDLEGVDANTTLTGDQAFSFVGANFFTGVAGELRYQFGSLLGDADGNFSADFTITLTGSPALAGTDINP